MLSRSPHAPRTSRTLPDVQPLLLTPRAESFDHPDWLFEPKYDFRGLLYVTRKGCYIIERAIPFATLE
jgi:hypothetical protein